MQISLVVNDKLESLDIEPRMLLVDLLRERLGLTGTHVGCDTSQCGACTVHLNSQAIKSCTILAAQAADQKITTIEGVANKDGSLHPIQESFKKNHGLQCGFCTPGMIMTSLKILEKYKEKKVDEKLVRHDLEGNFCRCTGYQSIVDSILDCLENSNEEI